MIKGEKKSVTKKKCIKNTCADDKDVIFKLCAKQLADLQNVSTFSV